MHHIKAVALAVIVGLSLVVLYMMRSQAEFNRYSADSLIHSRICYIASQVLKERGRVFSSLNELQNTAYYPYNELLSPTCHGGKIIWRVAKSGNQKSLRIKLSGLPVMYNEWDRTIPVLQEPAKRTRLKMEAYVQGANRNLAYFNDIQMSFRTAVGTMQSIKGCPFKVSLKPALNRPITADLPRNEKELKLYVDWLQGLENLAKLQDEWTNELKFSLLQGQLMCRSGGADGRFNTKDDILIQAPKAKAKTTP